MKRWIKQAISFLMAICLLAGNSYVDVGTSAVTMSDWIEVAEETNSKQERVKEPLGNTFQEYFATKGRKASAADSKFVIKHITNNNATVRENEAVIIDGNMNYAFQIKELVDDVDGVIEEITSERGIVEINTKNLNLGSFNLKGLKAGVDAITIRVNRRNGTWQDVETLSMTVVVPIKVDRSNGQYWYGEDEDDRTLILDPEKLGDNGKYEILLKDVKLDPTLVQITCDTTGIIDTEKLKSGMIVPIASGETKVTIKLLGADKIKGIDKQVTFQVIVVPKGKNQSDGKYQSTVDWRVSQNNDLVNDTAELITNINSDFKINWEVFKVTYPRTGDPIKTPVDIKNTELFHWELGVTSENTTKILLSDLKAGTYQIVGYIANSKEFKGEHWNYVEFNLVVDMYFGNKDHYMNTGGDSFCILDNSNFSPDDFQSLVEVKIAPGSEDYLLVERNKGTVSTQTNEGTAKVLVEYKKQHSIPHIYAPTDINRTIGQLEYTFHIIDTIALSSTKLELYTNSEGWLELITTNHDVDVQWEPISNEYFKIEISGINNNFITIKTTNKVTTSPIVLTASQEINGVKKYATCEIVIQQAIEQITLSPNKVTLNIGETIMISAQIKPTQDLDQSSGRKIDWLSSDESVFTIDEQNSYDTVAKIIAGKKGGTAVLTALDSRNIIVGYCVVTVVEPASGIELSETILTRKFLKKGETYQLRATIKPETSTESTIIWSSDNTKVASVNQYGLVTFNGPGHTNITVQIAGTDIMARCEIVLESAVSGVTLDNSEVEMYVGESRRLLYTVTPASAANKGVTWTSFNTAVVDVDEEGLLVAKDTGTTQVMVMTVDGSYYALCTVTVKQEALGVKMKYTQITLNVGEFFDMDVTISPANSTEASLTWESLNPAIVTVSSTGRITARAAGTANVMVKTLVGATSFCTVEVVEPVISLELDPTEIIIDVEETFIIDPVFQPAKPSNMKVTWSSSDEDIAEIDEFGEVTGCSGGTAVITCESVDGGYRAFCLVTVIEPVIEVKMSPETCRLGFGKTYELTATVSNHGTATNTAIVWSSSDESVCTVDDKGKITGVGYGYATITAEAEDGFGASATCEVRIVREVTSIKLNHTTLTLFQGESVSLQATIQPSNAAYPTAKFSSSDESVAIVDEDGVITALGSGTTIIRADAKDTSGKYAICYITVSAPVAATGVTLSDKEIVMVPGEQKQVVVSIKPNNSTDSKSWTSNNESIATVNSQGVITAHTTGVATITVMTSSGKTATVTVTVLGLNRTNIEVPIYTKYTKLVVEGAVGTVRWDVADPTICEVDNGIIKAKKYGTTKVIATINGRSLTCTVKVVR